MTFYQSLKGFLLYFAFYFFHEASEMISWCVRKNFSTPHSLDLFSVAANELENFLLQIGCEFDDQRNV